MPDFKDITSSTAAPAPASQLGAGGITWRGLNWSVGKKQILHDVTGEIPDGACCAILGPSGSGKTTLLNALAGRLSKVEGTVEHGGVPFIASRSIRLSSPSKSLTRGDLRKHIAYVMQGDVLFAMTTPREALLFSAMLRLPQSLPRADKLALVEATIARLRLQDCADTMIGNERIRGISGGEKKRTSIGVELVMRPKVLFLDEPTSGLDSHVA